MITRTLFLYAGTARAGTPVTVQDCEPTTPPHAHHTPSCTPHTLMHTTPTLVRHHFSPSAFFNNQLIDLNMKTVRENEGS